LNTLTPDIHHYHNTNAQDKTYGVEIGSFYDDYEITTYAKCDAMAAVLKAADNKTKLADLGSDNIQYIKQNATMIVSRSPISGIGVTQTTVLIKTALRKLFTAANLDDDWEITNETHS